MHFGSQSFTWAFYIADVKHPLLGADFLMANNLAIDLRGRRLIDLSSYATFPAEASITSVSPGIHELRTGDPQLASIIDEFPDLLIPRFKATDENLHGVEHHLPTHGPPVFARPRRLNAEQYTIAQEEFKKMEELGIIQRSNSP